MASAPKIEPRESVETAGAPQRLLWLSLRALLPTLIFDIGGTMLVYYLLLPDFPKTSILPLLGASLVPVISNVFNFVRRRSFDVVGIIVLIGLLAGLAGAAFGGGQRLLLVRESFITGVLGILLIVSGLLRKPVGYYVVREFLTANEALPAERFRAVWVSGYFRSGIRVMTIGWGVLLLAEFCLRVFMAFTMSVAFVLGVAPVLFTILMLVAGAISAVWLNHAIAVALADADGNGA